ncbi:MAG: glutathione peroxidase [Rhodoferax sp.]
MKWLRRLGAGLGVLFVLMGWAHAASAAPQTAVGKAAACPKLLNQTFPRLQDQAPQNLCQYAGQVILVVNTASYCAFTPQYQGLEALYARYRTRGLVVLGFPSNNFGQQEPGSDQAIADFCFNTYAVEFPMFSKTDVVGPQRNALYAALTQATGQAPRWNFHKYLIDRRGQVVQSFPSEVQPQSPKLISAIEALL